ncbi:YchJ family protein [Thermomonospora cellulosilytica]|uniref:UPF0225 protein HNR21_004714 n=1 Tax=Thermomonospora cellulosilytica TaxID=1411118 RepID=A0A7W3N1L8_9ACTN|nr:YchJ family metal-binding protein [Thermomonospora cellulosilytica]MBA9005832.1 SEC-C motif-containing protein [Thermomonospora cellulosilytica]
MTKRRRSPSVRPCPCGLPASYEECCGRLHRGRAQAVTAEQLMRSRYSAFAVGDVAYLHRSWHPGTRPPRIDLDPGTRWEALEVLGTTGGSAFDTRGTVEFRARYTERGEPGHLHEVSSFVRVDGAWVYLNGRPGTRPAG